MSKGLVLVTGATGFLGTEVAIAYAEAGYTVRGTARSQQKVKDWETFNPKYKGKIQWFIADLNSPNGFDEAIKGVKYIAHTASPFTYDFKDNENDMLKPAIEGTKIIMEAAKKEPSVEHVVITSSFAAIFDLPKLPNPGHTYTRKDWNPATYEEAAKSDNNAYVYCASKVLAERAAWDDKEHRFYITTICPPLIIGPPRQPVKNMAGLNTSNADIYNLINGNSSDPVPATSTPVAVDVRDVALLHVRAVEDPSAQNQRILCIAFHIFNFQIVEILRNAFSSSPSKLARVKSGSGLDKPFEHYATDSRDGEELLGKPWITPEVCYKETAERLWELEEMLKAFP
ncbi:NAD dependent epimerase/dehydratase [Rickenella mellea]|uniref:NAD dependent epimerase/dehydratase n=1 Tax=Rickenella mellea TaxID=50990 RepID=A0A4Y7PKT3_9AGAM|nr:NAD dependent epimerase/dehydratase [Rickenella mellea]